MTRSPEFGIWNASYADILFRKGTSDSLLRGHLRIISPGAPYFSTAERSTFSIASFFPLPYGDVQ